MAVVGGSGVVCGPCALIERYLGSSAVVPEARKAWVQGVKNLLDYENVKRSTRKDGA